jgi:pyruvate kinase
MRRTKIVCTIGPASWDKETVNLMVKAGMNVARINGAFADLAELSRVQKMIREIDPRIALMLDIKGHEVRLNKFADAILVNKGDEIVIGSSKDDHIYPATFPNLYKDIRAGQKIMVDKGAAGLEVTKVTKAGKIHTRVLFGEKISPGKGMNFPGAHLSNEAITTIDKEQITYCAKSGWEYVSASFIRTKHDVAEVRKAFNGSNMHLIAKIEDQQGVDNIDEIIEASDGIMIARGDLGSEMPLEKLPMLQKVIIKKCNKEAKPVILATNLLESMTVNIFPTRAEVTDVANGVMDGADALMTSGETAQGKHPIESLEMLDRIAIETEQYLEPVYIHQDFSDDETYSLLPAQGIFESALNHKIDKILVISEKGELSRILSRYNLPQTILTFVSKNVFRNQLSLSKNINAYTYKVTSKRNDKIVIDLLKFAYENKLITLNDNVIVTGRIPNSNTPSPFILELMNVKEVLK